MDNENVVQMPTLLERLASKLRTCLGQEASNRQEWIAIQEAKCATLVEIRDQFPDDDIGFGQWCNANGFGKDALNDDTRAACIAMGRDPQALHNCLEATARRSLHTIFKFEFEGFRNVSKPPTRRKQSSPKIDAARAAVRELVESNKPIGREKISKQSGVSAHTIQKAVLFERGRLEGLKEAKAVKFETEPLPLPEMKPTMQQRYEATVRAAEKRLTLELTVKIREEVRKIWEDDWLPYYTKKIADAERVLASHKGVISRKDFRILLAGLHPDHNKFEQAREAFEVLKKLESVLVKPEMPAFSGPPLPKTVEELMARRREHQGRR